MVLRGVVLGLALTVLLYTALVIGAMAVLSADWTWNGKMGF